MNGFTMEKCLILLAAVACCSCLPTRGQQDVSPTSTNQLGDIDLTPADHTTSTNQLGDIYSTPADHTTSTNQLGDIYSTQDDHTTSTNQLGDIYSTPADHTTSTNQLGDIYSTPADHTTSTNQVGDIYSTPADHTNRITIKDMKLSSNIGSEHSESSSVNSKCIDEIKSIKNELFELRNFMHQTWNMNTSQRRQIQEDSIPSSWSCIGRPGIDGRPGVDGRPGIDGRPGVDGMPGLNGMPVLDGSFGLSGPKAESGPPGIKAATGSVVPVGSPGTPGQQGPLGPPGPPGPIGSQGPPGLQGAQGPQGPQGPSGSKGSDATCSSIDIKWIVPGGQYVGCFQDHAARTLPHKYAEFKSDNCPSKCIAHCVGYKYAGVQYSSACFCGDSLPPTEVHQSRCSMPCPGSYTYFCGGTWISSVYQLL